MAHRVGLLRRTDSVAIEGIADIGEALLPVGATRMTRLGHWTGGRRTVLGLRRQQQATSIQNNSGLSQGPALRLAIDCSKPWGRK